MKWIHVSCNGIQRRTYEMNLEDAYRLTKTKNQKQLSDWLGYKDRSTISKWGNDEIPAIAERAIKDKLSAIKAERAEARRLKMENKL